MGGIASVENKVRQNTKERVKVKRGLVSVNRETRAAKRIEHRMLTIVKVGRVLGQRHDAHLAKDWKAEKEALEFILVVVPAAFLYPASRFNV